MTLPTFLCLGVQRAATTWLHNCLSAHPDVYVPADKELHFFSSHWDNGLAWYRSHFPTAGEFAAVGEITPNYLHEAPLERIYRTLPEARIIVILREPVSRAYSAYRLLNGKYGDMTFAEACESGDYLTSQSLYAEKLRECYSLYPREQILVQLYDDVISDPATVYEHVCGHLGVDLIPPPPEVNQTFNHIMYPRAQLLLGQLHLTWAVNCVKETRLGNAIKRFSQRRQRRQVTGQRDAEVSAELRALFHEDIQNTEAIIGRDLSHWCIADRAPVMS